MVEGKFFFLYNIFYNIFFLLFVNVVMIFRTTIKPRVKDFIGITSSNEYIFVLILSLTPHLALTFNE